MKRGTKARSQHGRRRSTAYSSNTAGRAIVGTYSVQGGGAEWRSGMRMRQRVGGGIAGGSPVRQAVTSRCSAPASSGEVRRATGGEQPVVMDSGGATWYAQPVAVQQPVALWTMEAVLQRAERSRGGPAAGGERQVAGGSGGGAAAGGR